MRVTELAERWGVCEYCCRQFYIDREMSERGSRIACPACDASPREILLVHMNPVVRR